MSSYWEQWEAATDGEDGEAVSALLVGRRIVGVDMEAATLTLDSGTVLTVMPNDGGCTCGAGDYELRSLAECDNAITSVTVEQADLDTDIAGHLYEAGERLTIFVYAAGLLRVPAVVVEGDEGNGYYGRGFRIAVKHSGGDGDA